MPKGFFESTSNTSYMYKYWGVKSMVDPNIVETYTVGKEGFIVALCEVLGVKYQFYREN